MEGWNICCEIKNEIGSQIVINKTSQLGNFSSNKWTGTDDKSPYLICGRITVHRLAPVSSD